jgi:heterotetrameric sarcosine oxidase gamma subunit
VADLIPTPALVTPPHEGGGARLSLVDPGPITLIALYPGQRVDVAGMGFPVPGQAILPGDASLVWTGRAQAFLIGAPAPELPWDAAAVTDQTDGWACLTLTGQGAEAVLARLVALDLRVSVFPPGTAARSTLNHLPMVLWRDNAGFRMLFYRSMARTAWHELTDAMARVQARAGIPA